VPLISGGNVPVMPAVADVLRELQRKLPVAAGEITVRIRAPYTLTSVTTGVIDSAQWSSALSELERLRDTEAPDDQYYGMVRPLVTSGIAGIGYVNSIGSRSPGLSSLGWDASRASWTRTMIHELGHNYSRPHAPCGNVAGADASYPYANGALGPTPLFDAVANDVLAPTGQADIMGYCNGQWFSDYNLNGVSRFLEARPQALKDVAMALQLAGDVNAAQKPEAGELIVVSGVIGAGGAAELAPLRAVRADPRRVQNLPAGGSHVLRIVTRDGRTIEQRFDPTPLDHVPGEGHFVLRLPHPGAIERVEVERDVPGEPGGGRRMLISRASLKASAATVRQAPTAPSSNAPAAAASAAAGPWAEVVRDGDGWVLQWSAADKTYASLALAVGSARHVLALDATGGRWRIAAEALRGLPAGGQFEVSLSDGVDSTVMVVPRR
jgi:hypothetical protein